MITEGSEVIRTSRGDRLLVLCQTDPTHPEVLAWLDEIRGSSGEWELYSDEQLLEMTIHIFTIVAKSGSGES